MAPILSDARVVYMDNLRALAMLAGVLFHAGLAYSTVMHNFWPTADESYSLWVDAVVWILHLFRMPLFFVVAGFFAASMVRKRGVMGMLRNRFFRILIPFLIFWPLLHILMRWLTLQAVSHVNRPSPMLLMIKKWLDTGGAATAPPSTMHLWFLIYLMIFCVLVWVSHALELHWMKAVRIRCVKLSPVAIRMLLLGAAPLLLVPAMVSVATPLSAPESFFIQWWALLIFGFYFALGYELFNAEGWLKTLDPIANLLLVASLLACALFLWSLKAGDAHTPGTAAHLLPALMQAYIGLWMTIWCLCVGRRFLSVSSRGLRYIAEASYWVYLVHLPVLFAIQYYLLDVVAGWQIKLVISVLATLIISFTSYQLLVRHTPINALLHGPQRLR